MKVKYKEWLNGIVPVIGYRPQHKEIAIELHRAGLAKDIDKTRNALGNRYVTDGWLTCDEREALDEHYFMHASRTQRGAEALKDMCEVPYWEGAKDCIQVLVNPNVTRPKIADIEYITKELNCKPEYMRIIAAPDNRMNGKIARIKQGNILLMDMEEINPAREGVYLYTTKGKIAGIARLRVDIKGHIVFTFDNKMHQQRIFTLEELEKLDFKVIGRIIINYSQKIV